MKNTIFTPAIEFTQQDIINYLNILKDNPIKIVTLMIDIVIVVFLAVKLIQIVKETRAWQLIKGIAFLIIATLLNNIPTRIKTCTRATSEPANLQGFLE